MDNPFKSIAEGVMNLISKKPEDEELLLQNGPGFPVPQTQAPDSVEKTLNERGKRYGTFRDNSVIYVRLIQIFEQSPNWASAPPEVKHALGNIATKLARLLTGDMSYDDNWQDIAGYATLMAKICRGETR